MKPSRRSGWLLLLVPALLAMTGVALAQVSTNFDLRWHVISGDGGKRASPNYALQDAMGQPAAGRMQSTNALVQAGFAPALIPSGPPPVPGDTWEEDDNCAQAHTIGTDGTYQTHNFNDAGDKDWIKFIGVAGKSYVISTANTGPQHDGVVYLYNVCNAAPLGSQDNAFGTTISLEWDCETSGTYYLKFQQHDPAVFGTGTYYDVSVVVDSTAPSAPRNIRAAPNDQKLRIQWLQNTEPDVAGYRIFAGEAPGGYSIVEEVLPPGPDTTYYELGGLTNGVRYWLTVQAFDFSGNNSAYSQEISQVPAVPQETSVPAISIQAPGSGGVYTTTQGTLSVGGIAQDLGGNLSRVQVKNTTKNEEKWDYSLNGSSAPFHVEDLSLAVGMNTIQAFVFDSANHSSSTTVTVKRLGATQAAAIIMAGHNGAHSWQANIDNAANAAYRLFAGAGLAADSIYYLNDDSQDADGDGLDDVDASASAANLQYAIETWAAARAGPGKPLYLYLMDHGEIEAYCADGCVATGSDTGPVAPNALNTWLNTLESATGADQVNVIIEACHSGSFIDRDVDVAKSISKAGRVIISSTDRLHFAFASPQGAYFSDAFFSCLAASQDLKTCFDQAKAAVALASATQAPWLDDNGDGVYNSSDGSIAAGRFVAEYFGGQPPVISDARVTVNDGNGSLSASVQAGDTHVSLVWAAIYSPSFTEPADTTVDLGVPTVLLQADPQTPGRYIASYPQGFTETGPYRVVFYASDESGGHARPKLVSTANKTYLPTLRR